MHCPRYEAKYTSITAKQGSSLSAHKLLVWYMYILLPLQVELPAEDESFIQISTPLSKKRRRISGNRLERLSIIPRLDKSFTFAEEEDFEVSGTGSWNQFTIHVKLNQMHVNVLTRLRKLGYVTHIRLWYMYMYVVYKLAPIGGTNPDSSSM